MPAAVEATPGDGSLLQVYCLGGFVVHSGERELTPTGEEGASYKAWEILAFLAAQPGGAAPKEKLLDAVWPEVDEERAANRLRSEMNRLRGILARQVPEFRPDLVRCDRDGTCRLDTTAVWSDAHRFWALCSAARSLPPGEAKPALEQALALYRGDLLSSRATRFYDWVEERDDSGVSLRERYRDQYCWVAQRLACLYRRDGRPEQAVVLYKSLLKAEPTLEDIVRELYRCYSELGDLNALIREERHLRQALREAYYDPNDPEDDPNRYQPEPETVELFNRIRRELEERIGGAGAGRAAGEG
jgi:LuxR family maltose regulon positive regulatory protein